MAAMDKKNLERVFYMVVSDISHASTEVGDATNGRTATTAWAKDDEVIFKGKLKHLLNFAVMAFDVASVAVLETFNIVSERDYVGVENLGAADIPNVIDIDPAQGEGIVVDEDMTFLYNLTGGFRSNWDDTKNIVLQEKAVPANKILYRGSILQAYCYAMQVSGTAPVYELYDFGLIDASSSVNQGVDYPLLDSTDGPLEYEKALVTLANLVLSAKY